MAKSLQKIYDEKVAAGDLEGDPAQREVLGLLRPIRVWLDTPPPTGLRAFFGKHPPVPKGLYLWGGVGRGKSMLMDLFVECVDAPKRRVHFHAFMQEIHAGMNAARKRGVDDALKPVADAVASDIRLLAFDEMQISDITDAMIVGRLFERLFAAGVIIVTTSNLPPQDLYKDGLNRALFLPFIRMIQHRMTVHHLASHEDYRRHKLAGATTYFAPLTAETRQAAARLWDALVTEPPQPLALTVKGRKLVLPAFSNGVGKVDFQHLCDQPLGAADYLALAGAVRVLFLEEVPRLGPDRFDAAKRFVTLIDALYEAKVKLIVTAAAPPEQLFTAGEGAFAFQRTVSRLREMQSADWAGA